MFNLNVINDPSELRTKISKNYRSDEKICVDNLLSIVESVSLNKEEVNQLAYNLISKVRDTRVKGDGVDALMQEFKLSTTEGVALMCLAESLLRIPDKKTQDQLISDKICKGDWHSHVKSGNMFVNSVSWGLLITNKLVYSQNHNILFDSLKKIIKLGAKPLIRKAMKVAVQFMGNQFVIAEDINNAVKISKEKENKGYQFSYDMLGEAAIDNEDAQRYMQSYISAIHTVGVASGSRGIYNGPGISVKLSAIHPRYQRSQYKRVMSELYLRLKELYLLAQKYQIALFIDAEESERLEISLDLLEKLANDPDLNGFNGIGFVIQAYQKRAIYVIDYIAKLAIKSNKKFMIRLVKGAYWDSEIKKAQVDGQVDYPVFTRKFYTDLSYIACAKKLFEHSAQIYPAFATHNALSFATIYYMAQNYQITQYEFQCLYGMGETLYDNLIGENNFGIKCRVYAPVGTHKTLLSYLVRRLLENGANSSFVHQIVDKTIPIDKLLIDSVVIAKKADGKSNPFFPNPLNIYNKLPDKRINSRGLDLTDELTLHLLQTGLNSLIKKKYSAHPLIAHHKAESDEVFKVINPADNKDIVGKVIKTTLKDVEVAITKSINGFESWANAEPSQRANTLLKMADLLEENYFDLINLLVREAGKTINNAVGEIREAVDFCRYYANQVINEFSNDTHQPLGVFVCISPWNFPLAIFIGEISSAIVTGNSAIAKPSDQTNLIAFFVINLFYKAGVPHDVLQLLPGSGSIIGNALTKDPRIKGVIFTGSTITAQMINQNLASKSFESILIAETGGQNTMIVDSSVLPEQVVTDVIASGFDSAGQRCSALRVLYLQVDIADKVIQMLKGAMDELFIGNPMNINADVGPIIDINAQKMLLNHIEKMKNQAKMYYEAKLSDECVTGTFIAPTIFEISSIKELEKEVFGPVVHIIRFKEEDLDNIIEEINSSGYGLTMGLHSRIDNRVVKIYENIKAGNIYINRNMIGAVVGVQPFGGERMSGTGPKAGGPLYLYRLVNTIKEPNLNFKEKLFKFSKLDKFIAKLKKAEISGIDNDNKLFLINFANRAKQMSPLIKRVKLPDPTGEDNFMFFAKKGFVACYANNILDLSKQIICAFATDNSIILAESSMSKYLISVLPNNSYSIKDPVSADELSCVMVSKNYYNKNKIMPLYAQKKKCIISIIHEKDNSYNLHLLTVERVVSINTSASGGNTQLMTIEDLIIE